MIVWLASRGLTRRRALVLGLILVADAVVGPALIAWELSVLWPLVSP